MKFVEQWKKVADWGMSMIYSGTLALLEVAQRAAEKQLANEPWTPMGVCQEYAEEKGKTQWSVWSNIRYALLHSSVDIMPREAIVELVEAVSCE